MKQSEYKKCWKEYRNKIKMILIMKQKDQIKNIENLQIQIQTFRLKKWKNIKWMAS